MKGRSTGSALKDDKPALKKGPWTADEDDVLMEHVTRNGACDWSSIRSKGLLPRSGKSCRLRWVNKLRPGLKSGCKFSPEEEQIVINLQAGIGNKWATIATYLPGRTDNDVKNFWSTRQKRLARLLHSGGHRKHQRANHGKNPICSVSPTVKIDPGGLFPCGEESSHGQCSRSLEDREIDNADIFDLRDDDDACYSVPDVVQSLPPFGTDGERKPCSLDSQLPQFCFPQLPKELLDLPLLPDGHELYLGFEDVTFEDPFPRNDGDGCSILREEAPLLGSDCGCGDIDPRMPDGVSQAIESLFNEFPVDMLDYDPLPPPSSSGL